MLSQLLYLFLTLLITFALYPIWINFVYKFHMGEEVRGDGPESHIKKRGTPTMGGFIFIITVSLITFLFNRSRTQTLLPVFVAAMAGLFGLMEDFSKVYRTSGLRWLIKFRLVPRFFSNTLTIAIYKIILIPWSIFKKFFNTFGSAAGRGFSSSNKIVIQAIIAGFVSYWTYFKLGWDYISLPLIGDIHIGIFYPIFIFILFMMVLNFVAFTDGIDGLAGGLALIAFGAYWVIASALDYISLATFCATFIGALIPFLYFNVYPARIFMGDVGSHVLGATLAVLAVVMHREVALLLICGVFLIDGVSSPIQQLSVKLTKKRLFRMAPIHHHFELLEWPETKVALRFWLFGIVFGLFGIFVALL